MFILEQTPSDLLTRDVSIIEYKNRKAGIQRLALETENKRIAEKLYNFLIRYPNILFFPDSAYANVKYQHIILKRIVNRRTVSSSFNQWATKIVNHTANTQSYWVIINFRSSDNGSTYSYFVSLSEIMEENKIAEFYTFFRARAIDNLLKEL